MSFSILEQVTGLKGETAKPQSIEKLSTALMRANMILVRDVDTTVTCARDKLKL